MSLTHSTASSSAPPLDSSTHTPSRAGPQSSPSHSLARSASVSYSGNRADLPPEYQPCESDVDDRFNEPVGHAANVCRDDSRIMLDSGASAHCTVVGTPMTHVVPSSMRLRTANGHVITDAVEGSAYLVGLSDKRTVELKHVVAHAEMRSNLLSVGRMCAAGCTVLFDKNGATVRKDGAIVLTAKFVDHIFVVDAVLGPSPNGDSSTQYLNSMTSASGVSPSIWHHRMAHSARSSVHRLLTAKAVVDAGGIHTMSSDDPCNGCMQGKMTRTKIPKSIPAEYRATRVLGRIHSDIKGPLPPSRDGFEYMLLIVDEFSRMSFVFCIRRKADASELIMRWCDYWSAQKQTTVGEFHSDNGGEFMSTEFKAYCTRKNIKKSTTYAYTPQQNGIAERMNRTLFNAVRSTMLHAGASPRLWNHALMAACHTINRATLRVGHLLTPDSIWSGTAQSKIGHLRVWGCDAWVHIHASPALAARSWLGMLVGYNLDNGELGYRVLHTDTGLVEDSRDVGFGESQFTMSVGYDVASDPDRSFEREIASRHDLQLAIALSESHHQPQADPHAPPPGGAPAPHPASPSHTPAQDELARHLSVSRSLERAAEQERLVLDPDSSPSPSPEDIERQYELDLKSAQAEHAARDAEEAAADHAARSGAPLEYINGDQLNGSMESVEPTTRRRAVQTPSPAPPASSSILSPFRDRRLDQARYNASPRPSPKERNVRHRRIVTEDIDYYGQVSDNDDEAGDNDEWNPSSRAAPGAPRPVRSQRRIVTAPVPTATPLVHASVSARSRSIAGSAARVAPPTSTAPLAAKASLGRASRIKAPTPTPAVIPKSAPMRAIIPSTHGQAGIVPTLAVRGTPSTATTVPEMPSTATTLPQIPAPAATPTLTATRTSSRATAGIPAPRLDDESENIMLMYDSPSSALAAYTSQASGKIGYAYVMTTLTDDVTAAPRTFQAYHRPGVVYEADSNAHRSDLWEFADAHGPTHAVLETINAVTSVIPDPVHYKDAMRHPYAEGWKKAYAVELDAMEKLQVWEYVILPAGARAIGCRWVSRTKYNAEGGVERLKGRIVAKGYAQVEGRDYNLTYAPVLKYTTLRVLLAIIAKFDMDFLQFDVPTAFLNATIKETVYMEVPEGVPDRDKMPKGTVCKLKKTLYGIKQAPREWNKELDNFIITLGWARCISDSCLYTKASATGKMMYLPVFVDDGFPASHKSDTKELMVDLQRIMDKYSIKTIGEAKLVLGMRITRDRVKGTLTLDAEQNIARLGAAHGIVLGRDLKTPMIGTALRDTPGETVPSAAPHDETDEQAQASDAASNYPHYRSIIGALNYIAASVRPDISFAVSSLASSLINPQKSHWLAARMCLKYVVGTASLGLTYGRHHTDTSTHVTLGPTYCDADWASNKRDYRSQLGYLMQVNGDTVSWASRKQNTIATSTCESEYMAMSAATKEILWLRGLMNEMGYEQDCATTLLCDNQPAIHLANNTNINDKTKHIALANHMMRLHIDSKELFVKHVPTTLQLADILTKSLPGVTHAFFRAAVMTT